MDTTVRRSACRGLLAVVLAACMALPTGAHGDWPPKHGGVMNDGETSFELVARERKVVLYLEDHGTPIQTAGAKGTFTVTRKGVALDANLQPAGENRLQGVIATRLQKDDLVVAQVKLGNGSVVVGRFVIR